MFDFHLVIYGIYIIMLYEQLFELISNVNLLSTYYILTLSLIIRNVHQMLLILTTENNENPVIIKSVKKTLRLVLNTLVILIFMTQF